MYNFIMFFLSHQNSQTERNSYRLYPKSFGARTAVVKVAAPPQAGGLTIAYTPQVGASNSYLDGGDLF